MKSNENGFVCKLTVHEHSFSADDVIIYKDDAGLQVGDVIEVYHAEECFSRLLVEVKQSSIATTHLKDSISIQSSLASAFCLRQFKNVIVNKVDKDKVTLDMLELVFKDQFVTRSDAWRLHQSIIGSCVYFSNKVSFNNMRVHVNEMWMRDDKVACGVVGDKTKVVYRSKSAKFHIFVQMSAEMWDFDPCGDLYFEKAIMGFLQDLFNKWKDKEMDCNHQVVIVLFSRTYYDVYSLDDIPKDLQADILCSPEGRYYRDFYKIIRQSEKQDNLQNVILDLKRSFNGYPYYVDCQSPGRRNKSPKEVTAKGLGRLSRASEGNLLEAINMSLNVFEKTYIDCNLEETNCTTLVITPSTGVFDVDEDLATMTRKRLIDNGVGVDLVCLAAQPLHAVPLFKFFSTRGLGSKDYPESAEFMMPQWINLSYYSKEQHTSSSVFVHRMQIPPGPIGGVSKLERWPSVNTDMDHEEYDAQIFNYTKPKYRIPSVRPSYHRNLTYDSTSAKSSPEVSKSLSNTAVKKYSLQDDTSQLRFLRSQSEEHERLTRHGSMDDLKFAMGSDKDETPTMSSDLLQIQQSDGQISRQTGVINPFKPQSMALALTLFRYRWLHAFPTDMKGISVQEHHQKVNNDDDEPTAKSPAPEVEEAALATVEARKQRLGTDTESESDASSEDNQHENSTSVASSCSTNTTLKDNMEKNLFESENWTTTIMTGVDWKSLCMPACLPLTISYFPDEKNLNSTYFQYHYTMVIEEPLDTTPNEKGKLEVQSFDRALMPPEEKFMEMVSQRIAQGFQFVTNPEIIKVLKLENNDIQSMRFDAKRDYVLSLGFIIHHLKLLDSEVQVTRYALREPGTFLKPITYKFNVWPHNCSAYSTAATEIKYETADKYNWNTVDRYICESESDNTQLNELMKYWRIRFLLLPIRPTHLTTTSQEWPDMLQIEGFLRFLEAINKIKRSSNQRQLFLTRSKVQRHKTSSESIRGSERRSVTPERSKENRNVTISSSNSSNSNEKPTSPMPITSNEHSRETESTSTTPRSSSVTSLSAPNDMPPEHSLSLHSPLADIVKAMLNEKYGLHFLQKQENIRDHTFISAEAVAWMIKSIDECNTKNDAVHLGRRLLEGRYIMHASESVRQSFVDGFFLYFIKEEKKEEETDKRRFWFSPQRTEEELLQSYNIRWIEVAVWREKFHHHPPAFLLENDLPPDILDKMKSNEISVPVFKSAEYNLNRQQERHRSEWCNIVYHGNYYPFKCAYMVELDWMVATGSVIAELIQKWSHRATSYGLHVVPAPMCAFPKNNIRCHRNPFRRSPFIPLNVECLSKDGQKHLFEEFDPDTWYRRMVLFQEAILYKFDFLRDIPQTTIGELNSRDRKKRTLKYVHTTGSILVKVNDAVLAQFLSRSPTVNSSDVKDSPFTKHRTARLEKTLEQSSQEEDESANEFRDSYGFFWVYNYALSKKGRTSFTGDVDSAKKFMMTTFSDFCSNKDDMLVNFWNESMKAMENYAVEANR